MTTLYGLIGYPLGHSFSQKYFTEKFGNEGIDALYKNFPIEDITQLPALLDKYPQLSGFNVTIPYKEKVMQYLDEVSGEAIEIGAVNCVKITDGKLIGYNTDAFGFESSLLEFLGDPSPKALILGSGGASKAVRYVLKRLGVSYLIVSRNAQPGQIPYPDIDEKLLAEYHLIINTTPLGTYPEVDSAPSLPYECLSESHLLYDLVYNPAETKFMRLGGERGAKMMNGWNMLIGQAERAWEIWQE